MDLCSCKIEFMQLKCVDRSMISIPAPNTALSIRRKVDGSGSCSTERQCVKISLQPKVEQTTQQHVSYEYILIRRTCDSI